MLGFIFQHHGAYGLQKPRNWDVKLKRKGWASWGVEPMPMAPTTSNDHPSVNWMGKYPVNQQVFFISNHQNIQKNWINSQSFFFLHVYFQNSTITLWWTNIAVENGHWNSGFSHQKWWFSIVTLVHQWIFTVNHQVSVSVSNWSKDWASRVSLFNTRLGQHKTSR